MSDAIPKLRVYIAGGSKEIDRCRSAMDFVREHGCEITCDWIAEVERVGSANEGLSPVQRIESAIADLEGVGSADVFWLLAPYSASTGAWVELGYALRERETRNDDSPLRIIVSGPASSRSIFSALSNVETVSDMTAANIVAHHRGVRP